MIVTPEEAQRIFNKLPKVLQSFYFHPKYVINEAYNKRDIQPTFFALEKDGSIFYHAFHLGKVPNTDFYDIQSPYGYSGPLHVGDKDFLIESIAQYNKWCLENSVLVEFVRFHPLIKNQNIYYGQVFENRQTVTIDLKKDDLLAGFSTRVRTAIRKAQKSNVSVTFCKSEEYIDRFFQIYTRLMDEKKADAGYYFSESYLSKLLSNEEVYLVSALNERDQVIGASIFFASGSIAEYHLSTNNSEGRSKNVANLILYEFAKYAQSKDFDHLYLGGGNDSTDGNSLLFYKRGFSKNELTYFIGCTKHIPDAYETLRKDYLKNNPKKENYILFYR